MRRQHVMIPYENIIQKNYKNYEFAKTQLYLFIEYATEKCNALRGNNILKTTIKITKIRKTQKIYLH